MYSQSTLIYLIKKKNHAEHMQANIIQKSHYWPDTNIDLNQKKKCD